MFKNSWENWVDGTEWESRNIEADVVRLNRSLDFTTVDHCKDFVTLRCIVIVGFKFFDFYFEVVSSLWKSCKKCSKNFCVLSHNSPVINIWPHLSSFSLSLCECVNIKLNHWESLQTPCPLTSKCVSFYFVRARTFSYRTIVWLSNLGDVALLIVFIQVSPLSQKCLLLQFFFYSWSGILSSNMPCFYFLLLHVFPDMDIFEECRQGIL